MTVRELIVQLMQHDLDKQAIVNLNKNELGNAREVLKIEAIEVICTPYGGYRETQPGSLKDQMSEEDGERVTDVINISS